MKKIALIFLSILCLSFIDWHYNLAEAKQIAKKEHRNILLNFSGSDWCGPCIRLHNEILNSDHFEQFAKTNLVLINADFPRAKKHQLADLQQKINDDLADKYNSKGIFPLTLLLDENGKVLKIWEGLPKLTPDEFVEDIKLEIPKAK